MLLAALSAKSISERLQQPQILVVFDAFAK